jgi:hypothetical protein
VSPPRKKKAAGLAQERPTCANCYYCGDELMNGLAPCYAKPAETAFDDMGDITASVPVTFMTRHHCATFVPKN